MKLSLNWLRDHVDIDEKTAERLPELLTMSTAEVETVEHKGTEVKGVVAGKIVSMSDHPQSEKLKVILVDTGSGLVQSVCGAPNVRPGIMVPFALPGGTLPGVPRVESATVAGVSSDGIACSPRELGIGESHEGVLELTDDCSPGDDVARLLKLQDTVIEIDNKSLTHRPDLWGHYGFAREIAALTGQPLKPLHMSPMDDLTSQRPVVTVTIDDPEKCLRYCALGIGAIDTRPSPGWLQTRLAYVGMRPINLIVDLTNYVMLEIGQPMHAFDGNMIDHVRVMTFGQVRAAGYQSSTFATLDGIPREIPDSTLMICNKFHPVAIAGIMGGENSEVAQSTTSILLESATFDAVSVRRSAAALGLRTEASMRFEKSQDTNLSLTGIRRFLYLIREVIPEANVYSGLADEKPRPTKPLTLTIDSNYVAKYAGVSIPSERVESILCSLGFEVTRRQGPSDSSGDKGTIVWDVVVPTYRATKDITLRVDLIEEIARVYGYDNIEPQSKVVTLSPVRQDRHIDLHYRIKQTLATSFGMSEVHTYSWYDKEWNRAIGHEGEHCLKIINPGISKHDTLRRHLVPNLLATTRRNEGFYDEFRLFEVGSVYHPVTKPDGQSASGCSVVKGGNLPSPLQTYINMQDRGQLVGNTPPANKSGNSERIENIHLCCVVHWKGRSSQEEDEATDLLKQAASAVARVMCNHPAEFDPIDPEAQPEARLSWVHPVKRCSVSCQGIALGYITVINPHLLDEFDQKADMALMEINLSALAAVKTAKLSFEEPPRYPQVSLDFSLLVDRSRTYRSLLQELEEFSHELLRSISYVDTYSGKGLPTGKKSVTIAITIASDNHTLSSEEISDFSSCFVKWLETRGICLR